MAIRSRTLVRPPSLCPLLIHVDEVETPSRTQPLCAMDSRDHLMVLASIAVAEVRLHDLPALAKQSRWTFRCRKSLVDCAYHCPLPENWRNQS